MFKESFFTFRESEGDLILRGTVLSTKFDGMIFSYGLSVYGSLFWILGLPAGSIENDLAIKISLEQRSSRKVLWEKTYATKHDEGVFWFYSIPSFFWYEAMLKELMPRILSDLEQSVKEMTSAR